MMTLISVFSILLFSGCSQFQKKKTPEGFANALSLMKSGDVYKAVKLFELLCNDGHQISCWASGKKMERTPALSIMQGATDSTSTQFVLVGDKKKSLQMLVRSKKTGRVFRGARQGVNHRSHSSLGVFFANFQDLDADPEFDIAVSDGEGAVLDIRSFKLLPDPTRKKLRFALASCMQESYDKEQKQQWPDLLSYQPDVLFMIGDNVYVDIKKGIFKKKITPELIWDRNMDARQAFQVFYAPRLVPVFATWDDHDYGVNNGGANFAYKNESAKIFNIFFPQEKNKVVVDYGPGVSRLVKLANQYFFFLDDRTFRSAAGLKKGQSHFGVDQEAWIIRHMKEKKGPFWLISGDQFFGGYHPHESYQGNHPVAFDKFMFKLRQVNRRFALISGDRHLTEIMKLPRKVTGFQTYELTSSGIHTIVFPGSFKKWPNPLAIEAVDGVMNFMIVDSEAKGRGLQFEAHSVGLGNKSLFKRKFKIQ